MRARSDAAKIDIDDTRGVFLGSDFSVSDFRFSAFHFASTTNHAGSKCASAFRTPLLLVRGEDKSEESGSFLTRQAELQCEKLRL